MKLCTSNFCLKVIQSTEENSQKEARVVVRRHGSFTMTMCRFSLVSSSVLYQKSDACSQPPYLTDVAPCDFSLFPKIKSVLKKSPF